MKKKLQQILAHPAGMTALMTSTIVIGGIFAYIFQILMIKMLPSEQFLLFQRYLSFTNIVGTVASGLVLYMTHEALQAEQKGQAVEFWHALQIFIQKHIYLIFLGCFGVVLAGGVFFELYDSVSLLIVWIAMVTSMFGACINGGLRGIQWFFPILLMQIIGPILKLTLGTGLVRIGWQGGGALLACVLSGTIPLCLVIYMLYNRFGSYIYMSDSAPKPLKLDIPKLLENSCIVILLGFLMNSDVLFVQYAGDKDIGAVYASVSLLAKSLAFLLSAIEIVLLSTVVANPSKNILRKPAGAIIVATIGAIGGSWLFGDRVLGLMKTTLIGYARLLCLIVLNMGYYGLISFYAQYLVLRGNRRVIVYIMLCVFLRYITLQLGYIGGLQDYIASLLMLYIISTLITGYYVRSSTKK